MAIEWQLQDLVLALKFSWKISRNTSDEKHNFIVCAQQDAILTQSEVAFNTRYGENLALIQKQFENFQEQFRSEHKSIISLNDFQKFLDSLHMASSLRFGIESAYIHLQSRLQGVPVWQFLNCAEPKAVISSFSLPILEKKEMENFLLTHNLHRFQVLKIKLGKEDAAERVNHLLQIYQGKIRIDANEAWESAEQVLKICSQIKDIKRIEFIEQPLPANNETEAKILFLKSPIEIFADEALTCHSLNNDMAQMYHGINVKLMKAGGYMKALEQLRRAKALGMKRMLGCMIESSMGIWAAMQISSEAEYFDLDGFLIVKEESFELVTEENSYLRIHS